MGLTILLDWICPPFPLRVKSSVVNLNENGIIVRWLGDILKIKVKAPPEKGKANAAVIELLATKLSLDKALIQVVKGHRSPSKILSISGLDDGQIRNLLKSCKN